MKRPLHILLALVLLGLCSLCIFQWKREADFRAAILDLSGKLHAETKARVESQERISTLEAEIKRIETLRADTETKYLSTLDELSAGQADSVARGQTILALAQLANQPAPPPVDVPNQNAVITKQNELLKQLAAERDAAIDRLNKRTVEWNELTEKYNRLVRGKP